jgi:hypothetical protein
MLPKVQRTWSAYKMDGPLVEGLVPHCCASHALQRERSEGTPLGGLKVAKLCAAVNLPVAIDEDEDPLDGSSGTHLRLAHFAFQIDGHDDGTRFRP